MTSWTLYREFWFENEQATLQASEMTKVAEIALYAKQSPSLKVGLDGSMPAHGTDPRNQDLSTRRVNAIRDALIQAGVPEAKIHVGAFGDAQLARDRRVAVLIRTDN